MTLNDLATLALQTLGITPIGRDPSAKDSDWAKDALTRALAQLAAPPHNLASWVIDDTPDEYADAFIMFASPVIGRPYGQVDEAMRDAGLLRLRELSADVNGATVGTADYY